MSWRDDLPEIPEERIRREATHEGARRRDARRRRQSAVLYGGMGAAAVALIIFAGAQLETGGDDDDDAATETLTAPAGTSAATTGETTSGTEAPGTSAAPGTTAAPATTGTAAATTGAPGTTAAAGTTPAEATTVPDYTTIGGPIAALPPSPAVMVVTPTNLWEQPARGPDCGPTLLTVVFDPGSTPQTPVVHWETAGVRGESPMVTDAREVARETIGPFPADTLEDGAIHEVLVYVTDAGASGDQIFRAPTVILRDCSP